ncbi:MAG: phosphomannomutase/phosphoglucomutase, partial [Sinobacterium sp.]|nr:phosphomannomutase/phosphoglucomutase [Sinobacterium sp.]
SAPQIFKDYDIRGLVSTELTEENVIAIGKAIGSEVLNQGGDKVVIGFDARSSSDALAAQLSAGIHSTGCDTISIGQALSPTLYFATHKLSGGNGVMITGSHLSDSHNGFKVLINKQTLLGEQLQNLLARIQGNDFKYGAGKSANASVDSDYTQEIAGDIITARGLKIVVDNHNEIAATLVSQLLHENDCDIINVTSDNSNQAELISDAVVEHQADFGIAFDSDADRLMVTSSSGSSIDSDKLIMLFAQDISSRNPGSSIVYDVKCSRELGNVITQAGSRPVMHKAGHSNIKAKVFELDAVFAGEFTGHFYFNDRWYGFDDAIYAAMRLAELISSANESLDERLQTLPQTSTSPEYIIETSSDEKKHEIVSYVENAMESQQGEKITIDGFRIEFEAGWGLVRASNTSQAITLRFEAQNDELLKKLQALFKAGLRKADPTLVIPF